MEHDTFVHCLAIRNRKVYSHYITAGELAFLDEQKNPGGRLWLVYKVITPYGCYRAWIRIEAHNMVGSKTLNTYSISNLCKYIRRHLSRTDYRVVREIIIAKFEDKLQTKLIPITPTDGLFSELKNFISTQLATWIQSYQDEYDE